MKIEGLGMPQQPDPKDKKIKDTEKTDTNDNQKTVSDSIELSKSNNQVKDAGYSSQISQAGTSDVTSKKDYTELKDKTSTGYYDSQEVREKTSDKLIDSEELKDVVKEYHLSNLSKEITSKSTSIRHDKVAVARDRISQGFYDNPDNYGEFADKMINHFGL